MIGEIDIYRVGRTATVTIEPGTAENHRRQRPRDSRQQQLRTGARAGPLGARNQVP
jgi:hypothetical protein